MIGRQAFDGCPIAELNLPEGLLYVGWCAFNSTGITSVTLPQSLKWLAYNGYNNRYNNREGSYCIIKGDGINSITVAEGFSPRVFCSGNLYDIPDEVSMLDVVKGSYNTANLLLRKEMDTIKLVTTVASLDDEVEPDGVDFVSDLVDAGVPEEEAINFAAQYNAYTRR